MESLILKAKERYLAYFVGGQNLVWYYKSLRQKQSALKLISNDIDEIEHCYSKLKTNGLLVLVTNLTLLEIDKILKNSEIVYFEKFENKQIGVIAIK